MLELADKKVTIWLKTPKIWLKNRIKMFTNSKQDEYKGNLFRDIIIKRKKNTKIKKESIKSAWEKQYITYRGTKKEITSGFSSETLEGRRQQNDFWKKNKTVYTEFYIQWNYSSKTKVK